MADEEQSNGAEELEYQEELSDNERDSLGLEQRLKRIEEKLKECQKEKEEYLLGWQRAKADFINYKNDEKRRTDELKIWLIKTYILTILPILDDFEKAFNHLPKEFEDHEWIKGVLRIKDKLANILKELGVVEIKSIGEKFNSEFHEAVGEVESDKEEGIVVEEFEKGYIMDKIVIRPAKVKVAKSK